MTDKRSIRCFALALAAAATLQVGPAFADDDKGKKPAGDNPAPDAGGDTSGGTLAGAAAAKQVAAIVQGAMAAAPSLRRKPDSRNPWTGRAEIQLYFLPDGRAVDPLPVDLSERDDITVFVVLPTKMLGAARMEITACPDRNPYRVNGDFAAAKKIISAESAAPSEYVVQPMGRINCGAGQVSLHVGVVSNQDPQKELAGTDHTLTLGSVFWGTVGIGFGFDFTKSGALSAEPVTGGSVIVRNDDLLGPKVTPMFLWHPFGLDPQHASVFGVLVSPTLGLDLDAITTSFFVGDSICWNGLCLCAAAHIRKTDQLKRSSGLMVNGMFDTTTGDLPVEKRWSSSDGGIGFFAGVVLDVNTAAKIIGGGDK